MPANVGPVVIWACVAAFLLCLVGALLVLFERWTPRNAATRKWLLSGVLFSPVGAVASYAAGQFNASPAPASVDAQRSAATKVEIASLAPATPTMPPSARSPGADPGAAAQETAAGDLSPAVSEWAAVLGPRPGFETAMAAAYPACVARLREQDEAAVSSADAAACRRALLAFHTERILPVYNRKAPYEQNLELQEETLGPRRRDADILPRYIYVLSEMERLRGEQWDRFVELDRRIQDDTANCLRRKCRAPD